MLLTAEGWSRVTGAWRNQFYKFENAIEEKETYPWDGARMRKFKRDSDTIQLLFRYHAEPGMSGDYKMAIELNRDEITRLFWALNEDRTLREMVQDMRRVGDTE